MAVLNVGIFKLDWSGDQRPNEFQLTAEDDARLAALIASASCDAIGFVDVVDVARFEKVLELAGPEWRMRDVGDQVTATPDADAERTVFVWNHDLVELIAWTLIAGEPREPLAVRIRDRATSQELTAVLGHPACDASAASLRGKLFVETATWLATTAAPFAGADAMIFGDFGPLAEPHATTAELVVIDHFALSPSLATKIASGPTVLAYEDESAIGGAEDVGNWKPLSDHRIVRLGLALG